MYISILNFSNGRVVIHRVSDDVDAEDYVSENFGLDNVDYMTTMDLDLEMLTIK